MRNTALGELRDADEIRWHAILSAQVLPEFVEDGTQMAHGIFVRLEVRRVEGKGQEVTEVQLLRDFANCAPGIFCFSGSAVATGPSPAVDSPKDSAIRLRVFSFDAPSPAELAAPYGSGEAIRGPLCRLFVIESSKECTGASRPMRAPPSNSRDGFSSLPAGRVFDSPPAVSQVATCRLSRGTEPSKNRCPLWFSPRPANSLFISMSPLVCVRPAAYRTQVLQRIAALEALLKIAVLLPPRAHHAPRDAPLGHGSQ